MKDPIGAFEDVAEAFSIISANLKGVVVRLMADGWSEAQAKDIAVAGFVMSARPTAPTP